MWELLSPLKEAKENHGEAFASNSFIYHVRMWFCISWSEKLPKFKKVLELTLLFLTQYGTTWLAKKLHDH